MLEPRYITLVTLARHELLEDGELDLDDPQDAEDLAAYDFALGEN